MSGSNVAADSKEWKWTNMSSQSHSLAFLDSCASLHVKEGYSKDKLKQNEARTCSKLLYTKISKVFNLLEISGTK